MDGGTLAALITAGVGVVTAAGAWWNTQAGRRDTARVQEAKEEIEHERLQADRDRDGVRDRDRFISMLQQQLAQDRLEHEQRVRQIVDDNDRRVQLVREAYEHAVTRASDNATVAERALPGEHERAASRNETRSIRDELDTSLSKD
jgi:hypothetical protein